MSQKYARSVKMYRYFSDKYSMGWGPFRHWTDINWSTTCNKGTGICQ